MLNKTYASGQTPQVGDIVKVSPKNKFNYYSEFKKAPLSTYRVAEVYVGPKSTLVKLKVENDKHPNKGRYTNYYEGFCSAYNFQLVQSAGVKPNGEKKVSHPKYMIVDAQCNNRGLVWDKTELDKKLSNLLLSNPTQKYYVFGYVSTAKTEQPKIEYVVED